MKKILIALSLMLILCIIFVSCNKEDNNITENEAIISAYNAFLEENSDVEANSVVVEVLNGSERLKIESSGVWYICFHKITEGQYTRNYIDYLYLVSKDDGEVTTSIAPENTSNYVNYDLEMTNGVERGVNSVYNDYSPITVDDQIDKCCIIKFELSDKGENWNVGYEQFCTKGNERVVNHKEEISMPKTDSYDNLKNSRLTINGDNVQFLAMGLGSQESYFQYAKEDYVSIAYPTSETNFSIEFEFEESIPYKVQVINISRDYSAEKRGGTSTTVTKSNLNGNEFELEFSIAEPNCDDIYVVQLFLNYSPFYGSMAMARVDFAIQLVE